MFARLREHFSEEQIVELTLRTALCGFFNRFNEAMQIEMEDGVLEDMMAIGAAAE
jgi:alkylhydroperoxidase family enzyme